ncbi:MAG TPA: hypothetical protein VK627_10460, partial [Edaphobacter sp.]|nr:hypothetical protein [Edaphobacter sp.]
VLLDVEVLDGAVEEFFFRRHGSYKDSNVLGWIGAGICVNFRGKKWAVRSRPSQLSRQILRLIVMAILWGWLEGVVG